MKWRNVAEELPKITGKQHPPVLVSYKSASNSHAGRKTTIAVYTPNGWKFLFPRFKTGKTNRVTHWMPFPEYKDMTTGERMDSINGNNS